MVLGTRDPSHWLTVGGRMSTLVNSREAPHFHWWSVEKCPLTSRVTEEGPPLHW